MKVFSQIRRRARQAMIPLLAAGAVAYFGYHAVQGERGIYAWIQLKQEVAEAQVLRDKVSSERQAMERRVTQLSPATLDLDMLEERARLVLNMGRANEMVIFSEAL